MKIIKRYELPMDNTNHELIMTGDPGNLLVVTGVGDALIDDALIFWAPFNDAGMKTRRTFRVVVTDQGLPANVYRWWGSAWPNVGDAVHLVELRG